MGAPTVLAGFRLLLARPGELTRQYAAGRRAPHPLLLFLFANLLLLATLPIAGMTGLARPLRQHLYAAAYSDLARDAVRQKFIGQDSVEFGRFESRFDARSELLGKALVILLVPLLGAALHLARSWKGERFSIHVVFATHFMTLAVVACTILGLVPRAGETAVQAILALATAAWLYPALRRAFGDGAAAALARAAFLTVTFIGLLAVYRFLLFFTVLYSV